MSDGNGRDAAPLDGVRVVEVALGVSVVGAGLATSLPGALLRDLGAHVTRVQPARTSTLDRGVEFHRAWHHGKHIVHVDDERSGVDRVTNLAREADMLFVAGSEALI